MDGIVYATRAGLGFALWTGMMGYMAAVIAMSWIIIMPMARTALRLDDADQVRRGR